MSPQNPGTTRTSGKYTLFLTCPMYPEQYDVHYGATKVGYIRLRYGRLNVHVPDCGGQVVLTHCFEGEPIKGFFRGETERARWLEYAVRAIDKERRK